VGISKRRAGTIKFDDNGNHVIGTSKIQVNVNREGALNICLGRPNLKNTVLLDEKKAVRIAQELIGALDFDQGIELKQGHVRHRFTCGGTLKGSGRIEAPVPVETIVQFRQSYKGLESVNSDHGLLTVCVDNDGSIINVYNSTRAILGEADKPRSIIASPPEKIETKAAETEAQFDRAVGGILGRRSNARDRAPGQVKVLSERVGYDFAGKMGLVVRQRNVDVVIDRDLRKRYKIRIRAMG
jgi:hypothetical protein